MPHESFRTSECMLHAIIFFTIFKLPLQRMKQETRQKKIFFFQITSEQKSLAAINSYHFVYTKCSLREGDDELVPCTVRSMRRKNTRHSCPESIKNNEKKWIGFRQADEARCFVKLTRNTCTSCAVEVHNCSIIKQKACFEFFTV
ncbi:Hypothetical protein mma_0629 [Janthinobacterium sp. Marseille]|nr:Hypothetical protein mma_0629 [Janthinobacterium sp. Marseille]